MFFSNSFQNQLSWAQVRRPHVRPLSGHSGCPISASASDRGVGLQGRWHGRERLRCRNTCTGPPVTVRSLSPAGFLSYFKGGCVYHAFSKGLSPTAALLNTYGARHPVGSPSISSVSPPALLINPFYRCIDADLMMLRTCPRSRVS